MAWIAYPYSVKHRGADYAPGQPIEVEDAGQYPGAYPVNPPAAEKRRSKTKKTEREKEAQA